MPSKEPFEKQESKEPESSTDESISALAYKRLFGKVPEYIFLVKYSRKLKDYNANARMVLGVVSFNLNIKWKEVDDEIKIGLIQSLLVKLFNSKKKTVNMKLYETFIKSLDKYDKGICNDKELLDSFNYVNERLFDNTMDMPNIKWGRKNKTRLGSYNFHTNTITISSIFKGHPELINAIMHHELLHKKLKFEGGRYHTKEFKKLEKRYDKEKEIREFLRLL